MFLRQYRPSILKLEFQILLMNLQKKGLEITRKYLKLLTFYIFYKKPSILC